MTQNAFDSRETSYDLQEDWNNFSQWQTEASTPVWQAPTPGFLSSAASNTSFTDHHSSLQAESQSQFSVPPLLQSDNFAVHYAVEWKATLNKRPVLHETEDSEMKPREFWESYLKPKIDKLLADNFPDKMLQIVNTNLMVLVDERGYRNKIKLIRQFPKLKIDWHVVESQLIEWAELYAGMQLRVQITVNYNGSNNQLSTNHRGRVNKRGGSSASQHLQADRAAHIRAEENSLGRPSAWERVYDLMRCPGPPCRLGPHCWRDPKDKMHYKLGPRHLEIMVRYVEQRGKISSHEDVPDFIRQEIMAAAEQRQNQSKNSHHRAASYPPISITNVLPTPSSSAAHQMAAGEASTSATPTRSNSTDCLNVQGCRDDAVIDYTEWQISQARSDSWRDGFQRCGAIALEQGLDLDLLYRKGPAVYDGHNIKKGLIEQYARDIKFYVEKVRPRRREFESATSQSL